MARLTKKVKLGVPRFLVLVLVAAVCGIQYPLWVGKGSNATLLDLQDQLKTQKEKNAALELEISSFFVSVSGRKDASLTRTRVVSISKLGIETYNNDEVGSFC